MTDFSSDSQPQPFSDLGIGILSWRGYESLRATLESYQKSGLFDCFSEKLLFLPQIEDQGIALAQEFRIPYQGTDKNLGIMGGFKAMAEAMTSDYVLLAENDFQMSQTHDAPRAALGRALQSLKDGRSHVWRFRHLKYPGQKFYIEKTMRYWPAAEAPLLEKLGAFLRRFARPTKAHRLKGLTPYFRANPAQDFPDVIKQTESGDFLVRTDVINWANNVFLVKRSFFLEVIIPEAERHISGRLINGFPTIETELNRSEWWKNKDSGLWAGISNPGLFTHDRLNDRGY